jgi:hypothetical protein
MARLNVLFPLGLLAALIAAACWTVPRAVEAGRLLAAEDDPVALTHLALEKRLDAGVVAAEIEAALDAGDLDLAASFLELARERQIAVEARLIARIEAETAASTGRARGLAQFARGFVTGEPEDLASLAGTAVGDLFVYGDVRDALREGYRLARGEEADHVVLGLASLGLAVTAGTYASLGAAAPARIGLTVIKAARKGGQMGARLTAALGRAVADVVDGAALTQAFARAAAVGPALTLRTVREAVKIEKAGGLMHLVRNVGIVHAKAGPRGALDALKLAEEPKDVARLARLAEAKGSKTRAILKLLGRGAILLSVGTFQLASWVFWALVNFIWFCAVIKRGVERTTLRVIRRRKARRLAKALPSSLAPRAGEGGTGVVAGACAG